MTVEQQVVSLATSVDELKAAVVTKKATLDASVVDAQSATTQAQAAKANALSARDQAGAFKDAAYTAAQSAASAVAYQDLTALAATKAVMAVDVFIYDTSKDSDGGAWRHRCAGTSWFNEPLNTATRGARREFPAVALIVATTTTVTIYDDDDPTLPMWMVFRYGQSGSNGYFLGPAAGTFRVAMLNGVLSVGKFSVDLSFYGHFRTANFISEQIDLWIGSYNKHVIVPSVIAQRNDATFGIGDTNSSLPSIGPGIVDGRVLDVAMTVLPDAPVDPMTGLPILTIAVGTAAGLSVIKLNGGVTDSAHTGAANSVSFTPENRVLFASHGPASNSTLYLSNDAEFVSDGWASTTIGGKTGLNGFPLLSTTANDSLAVADAQFIAQPGGLSTLRWQNAEAQSLLHYTTASYATGWMPGDIKGAFLADAADTDLVGDGTLTAPDRSMANKPLLVVGSITREPVVTGAELIAYSGFSETNYLEGTDATYADTLYALGWVQTDGRWEFKHGVVSAAPIDGLTITSTTIKIAGAKPKALVRVTATTPTPTQLAKIQADERFLFQENAACTLYGASDAVTALAHDPDTGLLHVGTSAGRSVFQGLRRVANTTVPVTTAIAAAGGMVVDE
jgi:hypothetical protein